MPRMHLRPHGSRQGDPTLNLFRYVATLTVPVLVLCSVQAHARENHGPLELIVLPNDGVPALTTPGGAFDVRLQEQATLSLYGEGGESFDLEVTWTGDAGNGVLGRCTVPLNVPAGVYTLKAQDDANARAVYVYEAMPETYTIAHISDTHIGSTRHPRPAAEIFADIVAGVNESEAVLAVITGDLTESGTAEEFRSFLKVLSECRIPTFVTPGNHDRRALNYERYFGTLTYAFRFGVDGYLSFDTKDYVTARGLGRQSGDLQRLRRVLKPSRWSVGFTHRYEPDMGMRSQLVLFIDNPLDYLLMGHWHRQNKPDEIIVPWGETPTLVTPAAVDGIMRFIDMDELGLHPRAFSKLSDVE